MVGSWVYRSGALLPVVRYADWLRAQGGGGGSPVSPVGDIGASSALRAANRKPQGTAYIGGVMPARRVYICGHSADAGAGGRGTGGRHRRRRRRRAQARRKWRCNAPIAQGYARMRMRPALFVLWPARGFVPCGSKTLYT